MKPHLSALRSLVVLRRFFLLALLSVLSMVWQRRRSYPRRWLHARLSEDSSASYAFRDKRCAVAVWERVELYKLIVEMYRRGQAVTLLARQAPLYSLFFDIDIYGGPEGDANWDEVEHVLWDSDERPTLFHAIAEALLDLYADALQDGLEILVYSSSGLCRKKGRFKSSFHLVFPQLVVERPVMCWPDCPEGAMDAIIGNHVLVRDFVLRRVCESCEPLHEALLRCCDVLAEAQGANDDNSLPFLNDWSEIFDENPLWHDPRPDAKTGLRLPFTDKPLCTGELGQDDNSMLFGATEGRPKRLIARLLFRPGASAAERLPLPTFEDAARLGDASVAARATPTPMVFDLNRPAAGDRVEIISGPYEGSFGEVVEDNSASGSYTVELEDGISEFVTANVGDHEVAKTCPCPVCLGRR